MTRTHVQPSGVIRGITGVVEARTGQRFRIHARALTAGVLLAAALTVGLSLPADARADVLNPSDCDQHATGVGNASVWQDNCKLGNNGAQFEQSGHYTTGVQRILHYRGFFGGTIDGIFGSLTEGAVANFQADEGLSTTNGVVNASTWNVLKPYVTKTTCALSGGFQYMRINGSPFCDFAYTPVPEDWYTYNNAGSQLYGFDIHGPH
jgi:hypothetical protein